MWSEQVDSLSVDERIWPRASAVGERLWSPVYVTNVTDATLRLNEFRCQSLARRGIGKLIDSWFLQNQQWINKNLPFRKLRALCSLTIASFLFKL